MKITINRPPPDTSKAVAYHSNGGLILPFYSRDTAAKNCYLSPEGQVRPNGTGEVGKVSWYTGDDCIFPGDSVTIQF